MEKKSGSRARNLIIASFVLFVIIIVSTTVSMYYYNDRDNVPSSATSFYFTSNIFTENESPVPTSTYVWNDTAQNLDIPYTISNFEDVYKVSENQITYTNSAVSTSGALTPSIVSTGVLASGAQNTNNDKLVLEANGTVPASFDVTVTVEANSPFKKTMVHKFHIVTKTESIAVTVNDAQSNVTADVTMSLPSTGSDTVTVKVTLPAGFSTSGSSSLPLVKNADNSYSGTAKAGTVYSILCFKDDPSVVLTADDVTVEVS